MAPFSTPTSKHQANQKTKMASSDAIVENYCQVVFMTRPW